MWTAIAGDNLQALWASLVHSSFDITSVLRSRRRMNEYTHLCDTLFDVPGLDWRPAGLIGGVAPNAESRDLTLNKQREDAYAVLVLEVVIVQRGRAWSELSLIHCSRTS
jgi:hypothetical protein